MPEKKIPELLSPAGSMDSLWAAINNGADAVYLGASSFGARSSAGFDAQALQQAVQTAHLYGKRVYVTLNTLIKEKEFPAFTQALLQVVEAGADAVLVQDTGALLYIKKHFPHIPVHASTQMTIHTLHGAQAAKHLGIDRVVFARETSISTLDKAAEAGIEVEVFVHGALCVSVSGQCTLSAMNGGRSGNRGRCAQPCRMMYTYRNQAGAWLSPRDIRMAENIQGLKDAGIASLKIEGRLKRPEYVAVVTKIYRKLLDEPDNTSQITNADQQALEQIFNRGGFSKGYVFGDEDTDIINPLHVSHEGIPIGVVTACRRIGDKYLGTIRLTLSLRDQDGLEIRGKNQQGMIYSGKEAFPSETVDIRLHKAASPGDVVYRLDSAWQLSEARKSIGVQGAPPIELDASLFLEPGAPAAFTLSDGQVSVTANGQAAQAAQKAPLTLDNTKNAMTKAGAFPTTIKNYHFNNTSPAFLPVSSLNQLRRDALEQYFQTRLERYEHQKSQESYQPIHQNNSKQKSPHGLILQSADINNIAEYKALGISHFFYAPTDYHQEILEESLAKLSPTDALVIPRQTSDDTLSMLISLSQQYQLPVVINNIGQLSKEWANTVIAGYGIHVWNNNTIIMLHEQGINAATLSRELTYQESADLTDGMMTLIQPVYGRNALMVLNHCPERVYRKLSKGHAGCRLCHQNQGIRGQLLTDRLGSAFPLYPLHLPEGCINYLLDDKPLHIGDKASVRYAWMVNMTLETPEEIKEIITYYAALRKGEASEIHQIPYYHGRYQKGVQ